MCEGRQEEKEEKAKGVKCEFCDFFIQSDDSSCFSQQNKKANQEEGYEVCGEITPKKGHLAQALESSQKYSQMKIVKGSRTPKSGREGEEEKENLCLL